MKDDWIEWNGGECPVPAGTLVDVLYRDGAQQASVRALRTYTPLGPHRLAASWTHEGLGDDIVRYRIAAPAEPPAPDTAALNAIWREYAKAAMSGMFADPEFNHPAKYAAELVADAADAMLAETVKRGRV